MLKNTMLALCALALLSVPSTLFAKPSTPLTLDSIEQSLVKDPENLRMHYKKCQLLFAAGKEQDSIDHAAITLQKFIAADKPLAWMLLGSIKTNTYKIDVHYNMGKAERAVEKDGIVRPYSFRVWTLGDSPKIHKILDFELAYFEGKVVSAAIGESIAGGHANYGILDPKSDFATVKARVLKVLE